MSLFFVCISFLVRLWVCLGSVVLDVFMHFLFGLWFLLLCCVVTALYLLISPLIAPDPAVNGGVSLLQRSYGQPVAVFHLTRSNCVKHVDVPLVGPFFSWSEIMAERLRLFEV